MNTLENIKNILNTPIYNAEIVNYLQKIFLQHDPTNKNSTIFSWLLSLNKNFGKNKNAIQNLVRYTASPYTTVDTIAFVIYILRMVINKKMDYLPINLIKILVEHNQNINFSDEYGRNVLMYSMYIRSSIELVQLFIDSGINVNAQDKNGNTAVHHIFLYLDKVEKECANDIPMAIDYFNNVFKIYKKYGVDLNIVNNEKVHILTYAIKHFKPDQYNCIIHSLIHLGADPNLIDNDNKKFLFDIIIRLLSSKIDNIVKTSKKYDSMSIAMIMVFHVLDTNILKFIINNCTDDIININHQCSSGKTLLMYAIEKNSIEIIDTVLKRNPDVKIKDYNDNNVLMYALKHITDISCLLQLLHKFIEAGCNVNDVTVNKRSCLMIAVSCNISDIRPIKFLVDKGANVNHCDNNGTTVLMYALSVPIIKKEVIKYLLTSNAAINQQNKYGETALMYCAANLNYCTNIDVLKYLIKVGADANIVNIKGNSASTYAAKKNNIEVVYFLSKYMTCIENRNNPVGYLTYKALAAQNNFDIYEHINFSQHLLDVKNRINEESDHIIDEWINKTDV